MAGIPCAVEVAGVVLRFDEDGRLRQTHAECAEGAQPTADVGFQTVLKLEAVAALQDDLPQLHKKNLVHFLLLYLLPGLTRTRFFA